MQSQTVEVSGREFEVSGREFIQSQTVEVSGREFEEIQNFALCLEVTKFDLIENGA